MISYQFTSSLNGLMRGTTDVEGWRDDPGGVWRADVCGPEEKDLRMMYLRNDELYTGSEKLVHSFPWTHLLKNESVDMLVLNNGAHQHSMEQYKPLVDEVVDYLKVHFKGRVVFRTTAPGHPNCWLQDAPRNSSYDYDNFLGPESQGYTWWHPLLEFNYYAAPRFSELERSFILNVEPLAKQRVDGHMQGPWNDCLHYHLPGPPDWWIVLFYNMLELAAIQENGGLLPVEDREPVVEIKA